ncbi:DUF7680 family protein [Microvirga roseola]|uniref:DUF7680 family protein n=1 Tax=Microvirga roseola TaxID=2883126 RepID=UPI001E376334|nr:hypothetical protein [Microvirga roseola]
MTGRLRKIEGMATARTAPIYEVRVRRHGPGDTEIEVWQLPSLASPHITAPTRIAGLRGRNLDLVEHRVLRRLSQAGIRLTGREGERKEGHRIEEDLALVLGLLFRTLAPMRSRDTMRAVAEGIEAMGREEAAYWLGMAMHRKNPRRVLTALRYLLTDPKRI